MSRAVINVEKLGKEYVIGGRENGGDTFREMIVSAATAPFRRLKRLSGNVVPEERIWALKDVSFEVKEGEVVGIIGRNGAGKSTLLKVLSRITAPTEGRVKIRGRVSSLLEVGTGFHWELTGRENIYLNGAILGMSRSEIARKFDEIVAFAEIDKFLDTPVKRYSSGMYLRLAFAVAAHLEAEILVIDEVLAVGDAEFQKKCLGKMSEVAGYGRTVLFVSHNMQALRTLCCRGLLLRHGLIIFQGSIDRGIEHYITADGAPMTACWARPPSLAITNMGFELLAVTSIGGQSLLKLVCSATIRAPVACANPLLTVDITDVFGTSIMQATPNAAPFPCPGRYELSIEISLPPLVPATYWLSFWLGSHYTETSDNIQRALAFEVTTNPTPGRTFPYYPLAHGYVVPPSRCLSLQHEHEGKQGFEADIKNYIARNAR